MSEAVHPKRDPPRPTIGNIVWFTVAIAALLVGLATFFLKVYAFGPNASRHIDAPDPGWFIDKSGTPER